MKPVRRTLFIVLGLAGALLLVSVVVFAVGLQLSLLDAAYFAITTITTVGYGDITLRQAAPVTKIFGMVVMVAGPLSMAAAFGIVTDALLRRRIEELVGRREKHMKDHIVLCGIGNVGVRVLERCVQLGESIVVVEKDDERRFVGRARELGVPVVAGDMREAETLRRASIGQAKSIIACTADDLANLEAALLARAEKPTIRVVLRMFNQNLARRLEDTLGVTKALSTSLLAAPAFAMAALDDHLLGSFDVDGETMLTLCVNVGDAHPWSGKSVAEVATDAGGAVLLRERKGSRERPPAPESRLLPGDRVIVCVPAEHRDRVPAP